MLQELPNLTFVLVLSGFLVLSSPCSGTGENKEQSFDYSDYAAVLKTFVDAKAAVNYSKLKAQPQRLEAFVAAVAKLPPETYDRWSENDKIAFWLNAYNGLTLKVIIDNYPIKSSFFRSRVWPKNSIRQIAGVWDEMAFNVMGQKLTLSHIEHKILRVKFYEPRIHMAMVCAAMGCPPLRNEPYTGRKLDEQLDNQARRFLAEPEKFRIDRDKATVYLSSIFKWFKGDFVEEYGSEKGISNHDKETSAVLNFIASYLDGVQKSYILTGKFKIKYSDYDWSLNEQQEVK